MLREMTASEYMDWKALWLEDPWGEDRADWRQALHTVNYANCNRDTKHHPKPFRMVEYCWEWFVGKKPVEPAKPQDVDAQKTIAKTIQAALAGKGVSGNDRTA